MSEFSNLYAADLWLLKLLNVDAASEAADQFWLVITQVHKQPWFLPYLLPLLLLWIVYIYRWESWKPLLMAALSVGITDNLGSRLIKKMVLRARPFENPDIADWLRKVGEAHGSSFPSNHAANIWAGALIMAWYFPRGRYFFYTFALLVTVSRVSLGVHYPSDVIVGMCLGVFVSFLVRGCLLNQFSVFQPNNIVSRKDFETSSSRTFLRR